MNDNTQVTNGKISIVVPVYNRENRLVKCIESIINQSYSNIELILIDDGSTDSSRQICLHYTQIDSRIKSFSQNNKGVSEARNLGLHYVTGQYLTFVDADDEIMDKALETALRYLTESEADVVTYGWSLFDENNSIISSKSEDFNELTNRETILQRALDNYSSCGGGYPWNKLWRIQDPKKIPRFDPRLYYFEDLEWCVRMILGVKKMVVCPEELYRYFVNNSSVSNDPSRREEREIGYHQSIAKILIDIRDLHELSSWFAYKYYPEIVNGVLFALKNRYLKLYKYLINRFITSKEIIKASCNSTSKMRFRYRFILLLSYIKFNLNNRK